MAKVDTDEKFSIQLNAEQKESKGKILYVPFSIIHGKAGSGKTLLACQVAVKELLDKSISKIVITRPTVSNEDNGFLPGTIEEKMEPWLIPIRENILKIYKNPDWVKKMENEKKIEMVSLSHFRGRTFENSICIVDEYQNMTFSQFAMCIGRLGKNSLMIFTGDPNQIDLKKKSESCVEHINKIKNSKYVFFKELTSNHRHEAVDSILELLYT